MELISKRYYNKKDINKEINNILNEVGLLEYALYYPNQLSGGMNQRVNIARALLIQFNIMIMDEPFKSIDRDNKVKIIANMKNRFNKSNVTVIFVTHNDEETSVLADKVIRLDGEPVNVVEEYYVDIKK